MSSSGSKVKWSKLVPLDAFQERVKLNRLIYPSPVLSIQLYSAELVARKLFNGSGGGNGKKTW